MWRVAVRRATLVSIVVQVFSSRTVLLQSYPGASVLLQKGFVLSDDQHQNHAPLAERDIGRRAGPEEIKPLDLWAIHDLLVVGHKGPLVMPSSQASHEMVTSASEKLAEMLPIIHPVAACRDAVFKAESLTEKARASWSCLGLSSSNFTAPYESDSQPNSEVDRTAPNFTDPNRDLGACKTSHWPRACSYWSSAHAMAVRADVFQKGHEFLEAFIDIIAGGALYCTGCTDGFRLLNKHILPSGAYAEDIMGY
jgi:hypothetical protein